MTALLELRQKISEVYGRYETYVRICTKCLLAFLVFYMSSILFIFVIDIFYI